MKKQANIFQIKEQDKSPEGDPNEMKMYYLPDRADDREGNETRDKAIQEVLVIGGQEELAQSRGRGPGGRLEAAPMRPGSGTRPEGL